MLRGCSALLFFPLLLLPVLLAGCDRPDPPVVPPADDPVVARFGDREVRASTLDAALALRLYDLDETRYELRRERLAAMIEERVTAASTDAPPVEILLAPPPRPRVDLDLANHPSRGPANAPITLAVFCDFISSHCKRLQPTLARLEAVYGDRIRRVHLDAPQRFHRTSRPTALAARCAAEQDAFWRYHDALYVDPDRLDDERLAALAEQTGLDVDAFERCRTQGGALDAVASDIAQAERLDLRNVPVSFVNGLYVRGPVAGAVFREVIDAELARLGAAPVPSPKPTAEAEAPAIRLVGTVVRSDAGRSMATFERDDWDRGRLFSVGEMVIDDWKLVAVRQRLAELEDGLGRRIELAQTASQLARKAPPERLPEPREEGGALSLSRALVDEGLADLEALERQLEPGQLDLEGKRLLKLETVEPGSLYETLGLVDGDVLMQVDGFFVHDQDNPLFEALRTRPELSLTIMRDGLPKTFLYRIE